MTQENIDRFGSNSSEPPSILITIDAESQNNTVSKLHYAVPLIGVTYPEDFFICRNMQTNSGQSNSAGGQTSSGGPNLQSMIMYF